MSVLNQIAAISLMNLRAIPRRLGASSVIVIGIAGVVAVLVSVMAMATGMSHTMTSTGRDDRAIVVRGASTSEVNSVLTRADVDTIADAPGIKHDAADKPIVSAEAVTVFPLSSDGGSRVSVPVRGVGSSLFLLRPEIKIVKGRMFKSGLNELIAGRAAQAQFGHLDIGDVISLPSGQWTVVGHFESGGDAHEGELLADVGALRATFRSPIFHSVTVQLSSPDAFSQFFDSLTTNPALSVDVYRERRYFEQQSKAVTGQLFVVTYVVGSIMALGAIFAALNTMYAAVSARSVEIATLRAIGFGMGPIFTSVMIEALLLAVLGGLCGAVLAWLFVNGQIVSTTAGSLANSQRVYSLSVNSDLIVTGITWAFCIGLIGGLFPSIRAAQQPVANALRDV